MSDTYYLIYASEDGPRLSGRGSFHDLVDDVAREHQDHTDPTIKWLSEWPDDWNYVDHGSYLLVKGSVVVPEPVQSVLRYKEP